MDKEFQKVIFRTAFVLCVIAVGMWIGKALKDGWLWFLTK